MTDEKLPDFLKRADQPSDMIVEKRSGENRVIWFEGQPFVSLSGSFEPFELREIADMMEPGRGLPAAAADLAAELADALMDGCSKHDAHALAADFIERARVSDPQEEAQISFSHESVFASLPQPFKAVDTSIFKPIQPISIGCGDPISITAEVEMRGGVTFADHHPDMADMTEGGTITLVVQDGPGKRTFTGVPARKVPGGWRFDVSEAQRILFEGIDPQEDGNGKLPAVR